MSVNLEDLGLAVKRVQDNDHRTMDSALRTAGISLVQWDSLRAIKRAPGASAHDLAVATFQSDQAFGTLASRLVSAGWVQRRSGAGRRIEHRLTAEGEAVLAAGRDIATDVLPTLFGTLTESERRQLLSLLTKLLP